MDTLRALRPVHTPNPPLVNGVLPDTTQWLKGCRRIFRRGSFKIGAPGLFPYLPTVLFRSVFAPSTNTGGRGETAESDKAPRAPASSHWPPTAEKGDNKSGKPAELKANVSSPGGFYYQCVQCVPCVSAAPWSHDKVGMNSA
ncbi:hypothetical protein BIW11_05709 [Tropilaelaps mercedesae]|uniref:Uncharacterized protein n=1 Tax=Tropilaelaps mercedesae TaxID=418985 RepID=A0A1V9Y168_9ACAR|nr:hypothetical protein BIW11_05709 [Tropilaelaps mercedesae]